VDGSDSITGFPDRLVGTLRTLPMWPPLFDSMVQTGAIMKALEVSAPLLVDGVPFGFHDGPSCSGFSCFIGISGKKLKGCKWAGPV